MISFLLRKGTSDDHVSMLESKISAASVQGDRIQHTPAQFTGSKAYHITSYDIWHMLLSKLKWVVSACNNRWSKFHGTVWIRGRLASSLDSLWISQIKKKKQLCRKHHCRLLCTAPNNWLICIAFRDAHFDSQLTCSGQRSQFSILTHSCEAWSVDILHCPATTQSHTSSEVLIQYL